MPKIVANDIINQAAQDFSALSWPVLLLREIIEYPQLSQEQVMSIQCVDVNTYE
jgi:hypothetical protein